MADKNVLQKIFIISQFPVLLEWFGSYPVMSYPGWMALATGSGFYLYITGIVLFEFFLWKKSWLKAASVAYPLQLAGIAAAFFTWPVQRIGEINPEFSYVMMSWGYPVAAVVMIIAWLIHIGIWFLKRDEKICNTA